MKKKIISILLALLCLQVFAVPSGFVYAEAGFAITAYSAVLYDASTNRILYSKNSHRKRAPASTTKLLTAMVVLDSLALDKEITIPKFAESVQPSKMNAKAGERYLVRDLLRATLISSSNDAAEVLAVASAGSGPAFAAKMNAKARAIGCRDSRFVRASGLPAKNQYSTAYDMAMIMKHAQKYSFIVDSLKRKHMVIHSLGGRSVYLKNHNKMLWKDTREVVGKTGWTRTARYCFVGHIGVFEKKIIVSMLGSNSMYRDLKKLVDYPFRRAYKKIRTNAKLWSTDETIRVQRALKNAGFSPGSIDGKFGPMTFRAVQSFQRAKGLQPDGIVGNLTWKKLQAYL